MDRNNKISLSLIVPLLNEESSIEPLYDRILTVLNSLKLDYEILFVDDGSSDSTEKILLSIRKLNSAVKVFRFKENLGQTEALNTGIVNAKNQWVAIIDGDLQIDPVHINKMIPLLSADCDAVFGYRIKRKDVFITKIIPSLIANFIIRLITKTKIKDTGCSLKIFRKNLLTGILLTGNMHRMLPVYLALKGARYKQIEIPHQKRIYGKSKYGLERILYFPSDLVLAMGASAPSWKAKLYSSFLWLFYVLFFIGVIKFIKFIVSEIFGVPDVNSIGITTILTIFTILFSTFLSLKIWSQIKKSSAIIIK